MPPSDPQDLALWLFATLDDVRFVGGTLWEGVLPQSVDFSSIRAHVEHVSERLSGVCNERSRAIGFNPQLVHVYEDLAELVGVTSNRRRVPDRFVIRSLDYRYPVSDTLVPSEVAAYMVAIDVWAVLEKLADIPTSAGLHFVASHDALLDVRPDFAVGQLRPLPSLGKFAAEFAQPPHEDQKRAIIRSTLIDRFKPRRSVALGEILSAFEPIETDARRSLAMYMSEFSVKKILDEVGRQNLDDTLSLNKTLSDIQNQLLALPAAILLAGATIKADEPIRNYAVLAGMMVFCVFMWVMVGNQRHSVAAIANQINIREGKVARMPSDSSQAVLDLFPALQSRVRRQKRTLSGIAIVVGIVVILTLYAVVNASHGDVIANAMSHGWDWLTSSRQETLP